MSGNPTVISTFCGTGGSSLGYKWAGYKELLAIDFETHAVECFKANFPEVPVWHKSVTDVTGQEILDFCNIKKGELDVFDGSPPCQGFSTAGRRNVTDSRNDLFKEYWRLIQEIDPKVFVMENVSGMIKGTMKGAFKDIMGTLKSGNYNIKCKLMNAKYYGVPQSRERVIFIGVRKDLNKEVAFPTPSNKIISCGEALKGIEPNSFIKPTLSTAGLLNKAKAGENLSKYHPKGSFFNYGRIPLTKPCPTVTKSVNLFHFFEDRYLAINEVCILCSFPEDWKLGTNHTKSWNRLGNAVMPKFMQAIAETIKKEIL